tara:strand:- start:1470 stop:1913 length:444 start_codon:yes stop_codon:yes gene_type:complete
MVDSDVTHKVRVSSGSIFIPGDFLKEEMDIIIAVEEIQRITLISDIEAIAGVGAIKSPSLGPGVYPRSSMTQTVYIGLDIQANKTGRIVIPREVDHGYIDLLSLSEEIEEKTGLVTKHLDDFTGRYYFTQGTLIITVAALIAILFGS